MNQIKAIRDLLGLTQTAFAEGIDCTQGNVGHYEGGQTVPPERALAVINFAERLGLPLTMGQVYGTEPLPATHNLPHATQEAGHA